MIGKRKHADIEKDLEKADIVWKDPFGYVFSSTDDGEYAKMCTIDEVDKQVDIIIDNRLRAFGVNP